MVQFNTKSSAFLQKGVVAFIMFSIILLSAQILFVRFNAVSTSINSTFFETESLLSFTEDSFTQVKYNQNANVDPILAMYRSSVLQSQVIDFFGMITGSSELSSIILNYANENNIAPSLAFALSWEESRYQISAVNKNASSIDRGLFQLNNKAFPNLSEKEFFNPEISARYGLQHLRYCIDLSGNEIAALAMYNAGPTKVRNDNTPKRTLDYVSRILSYKLNLESQFYQEIVSNKTEKYEDSNILAMVLN